MVLINKKNILVCFLIFFLMTFIYPEEMKLRSIDSIISDIRSEQGLKEKETINPDKVSPGLLEELGDAVMDRMIGNKEKHEFMDNMMGGEGSQTLAAMHLRIGYNYLTGNFSGYGWNRGMMGWGNNSMMGNGGMMMGGYPYNNRFNGDSDYLFMMNRLGGYLNLTGDQNEKIRNINIELGKKVSPLRVKILEKWNVLDKLLSDEAIDEKAAMKTGREISDITDAANNEYLKAQISVLKILTTEQRKKLPDFWMPGGFPMMYNFEN